MKGEMHMFQYIYSRYNVEDYEEYETLDEALDNGYRNLMADPEYGAWPLDILQDGIVLWSNRGGSPLQEGTCPLNDRLYQWGKDGGGYI